MDNSNYITPEEIDIAVEGLFSKIKKDGDSNSGNTDLYTKVKNMMGAALVLAKSSPLLYKEYSKISRKSNLQKEDKMFISITNPTTFVSSIKQNAEEALDNSKYTCSVHLLTVNEADNNKTNKNISRVVNDYLNTFENTLKNICKKNKLKDETFKIIKDDGSHNGFISYNIKITG